MATILDGDRRVRAALAAVAAGRPVVVADDAERENEGDLILAADRATPESVAFLVRHTSGLLCVGMPGARLDALALPPMVAENADAHGTAFTVSVDAARGVSTGISAADRALTARLLADPATVAEDLVRPGHVFPLRARPGGVLERPGHTEAAADLARLAGRAPAGLLAEIVAPDGSMARGAALERFAAEHDLAFVTVAEVIAHRERHDPVRSPERFLPSTAVRPVARARLPTRAGRFTAHVFADAGGAEHLALTAGDVAGDEPLLVRVHSECLTGDVLGSARCDCGEQLALALDRVAAAGRGIVLYLRGHEGRGIGLGQKLRAYALQDRGSDTVDANLRLGLPVDARDYATGARIIEALGARRIRLMTNNPRKHAELAAHGLDIVERVPLLAAPTAHNLRYLHAKQERLGHLLELAARAS